MWMDLEDLVAEEGAIAGQGLLVSVPPRLPDADGQRGVIVDAAPSPPTTGRWVRSPTRREGGHSRDDPAAGTRPRSSSAYGSAA